MKFTHYFYGSLVALSCTVFSGCEKNRNASDVLVQVNCLGKGVDQAVVYLKQDSIPDSDNYDRSTGCDAIGQAYFSKLVPGKYYLLAKGYNKPTKSYVSGSVVFVMDSGEQKEYKVTINTQ